MKVITNYHSAFWMTVLPGLMFTILGLFIFPYITFFKLGIMSWWGTVLVIFVGLPIAIVITFLVYYLISIPLSKGNESELEVGSDRISWKTGRKVRVIDFIKPYGAEIRVGAGMTATGCNVSIDVCDQSINVSLVGISFEEIHKYFPETFFIEGTPSLAVEAISGFDLKYEHENERALFISLLQTLWERKANNLAYTVFKKFPWDSTPHPETNYAIVLNEKDDVDKARMDKFKSRAKLKISDEFGSVFVDDDYILISAPDVSSRVILKDIVTPGIPDEYYQYYLMPLGVTTAYEYSWDGVGDVNGGCSANFKALDRHGKKVNSGLSFPHTGSYIDYCNPSCKQYLELEYLMKFVNSRNVKN